MNPTNKKATPQLKPAAAQPRTVVSAQSARRPVAPPPFRPQPTPKAVQPKMANGAMNRKPPAAPPVYRPQQAPRVLQTKSSMPATAPAGQAPRRPTAPPAYRPEAKKIVQPKAVSPQRQSPTPPPAYRPGQQRVAQPKTASAAQAHTPPKAPFPQPHQAPARTKVIQRNINSTHFEKSDAEAPLYMVNPAARGTLYGAMGAPAPQPAGLYKKKWDVDDADGKPVNAWTPNVRLFSKAETALFNDMSLSTDDIKARLGFPALMAQVENPTDPTAVELPTVGMLGKNDCAAFAGTLYRSIAREYYRGEKSEDAMKRKPYLADYPSIGIGDRMVHHFNAGECGWHAATVVAQDRTRQVTLEANVAKDLNAPEFYIRAGVAGFVTSNLEDGEETSTKVDITKYKGGALDDTDVSRYAQGTTTDVFALAVDIGTTRARPLTQTEVNAFRCLGRLLNNKKWDTQGWSLFSTKTPDGIVKMRQAFAQQRYWDVFQIAVEKNKKNDPDRTPLVRDLYGYLEYIMKELAKTPKAKYHTRLLSLMFEISTWDISKR